MNAQISPRHALPRYHVVSENGALKIKPVVLCAREMPDRWKPVYRTVLRGPSELFR